MESLRTKTNLVQGIKQCQKPSEIQHILNGHPLVAKLAERKLSLNYDSQTQKFYSLKRLPGIDMTVPYSFVCLKYDLSVLAKNY